MGVSLVMIYMLLEAAHAPNPPTIAHCRDPSGVLIFTDPPCPEDSNPIEWHSTSMSVLEFKSQAYVKRAPKKVAPTTQKRTRSGRKQECQRARTELKQLRADRRRGYRLSEAAKLDAKLDQLKSMKRKLC